MTLKTERCISISRKLVDYNMISFHSSFLKRITTLEDQTTRKSDLAKMNSEYLKYREQIQQEIFWMVSKTISLTNQDEDVVSLVDYEGL